MPGAPYKKARFQRAFLYVLPSRFNVPVRQIASQFGQHKVLPRRGENFGLAKIRINRAERCARQRNCLIRVNFRKQLKQEICEGAGVDNFQVLQLQGEGVPKLYVQPPKAN